MFVEGKSRTFFPSDTLTYDICRDESKNHNICNFEHMILGQLRMGARQMTSAQLVDILWKFIADQWNSSEFNDELYILFVFINFLYWLGSGITIELKRKPHKKHAGHIWELPVWEDLKACQDGLGHLFRDQVPQSARLSAGWGVQLLFG